LDLENGLKLVLPSPTMIVHRKIQQATRRREGVLLTGNLMGGGPSGWAAEAHARAGLPIYATPDAARSFNDDLEKVAEMGIQVVSEDEVKALPNRFRRVEMGDFDAQAIRIAFAAFGVSLAELSAVGVAVFDHGNAPVDVSDRQFRFDYLDERIRSQNRLSAFAHRGEQVPPILTRLHATARSAQAFGAPVVAMDTAPAAVLGASYDPVVAERKRVMIANVGNFHTLAFRLGPEGIEGVFEHHTGLLDRSQLERLLTALADGSLTHADVFGQMGHGALVYSPEPLALDDTRFNLAVTGPRRSLLYGSALRPYFAVPFGDMMMAGCFGLLAAMADLLPELAGPIQFSLSAKGGLQKSPWDFKQG
jgi:uncharacterized protein (DUF1786 family)